MPLLHRAPFVAVLRGVRPPHARHASTGLTIAIRREDPARIWERRCPLTPPAIHDLVRNDGLTVLVQPCERRVYSMRELQEAGATPHDTLAPAHIVLGIKETPLADVLADPLPLRAPDGTTALVPRTHLMFSHTHKGQEYNTPLLSKFLNPSLARTPDPTRPTLIDYELLTDEGGRRTVGFGWFAGVAGALESLAALAHALLERGVASPFLSTPRPHTHPSLDSLKEALRRLVGDRIASEGTPPSLGPIVICVTGTGKVAQGALDLLAELPIQHVTVDELPQLVDSPDTDLRKIYVLHALPSDYFVRTDGGAYARDDYYAHPDAYASDFPARIAPYTTLMLNGGGWAQGFPRIMRNADLAPAMARGRFVGVGDISCDVEGSLEFLPRHSTLSAPHFTVRPAGHPPALPALTMMAVDILPTALPAAASAHFSAVLVPHLRAVAGAYGGAPHGDAIERATVARAGVLREEHRWLEERVRAWRGAAAGDVRPEKRKNVLVLGSGMVAAPAVDEIARHADVRVVVASNVLADAERLAGGHANAAAVRVDMADAPAVAALVAEADVVVSLLPVPLHPQVAELCLAHRKHLVTASYISPAMRALHSRAVAADVLLLNEIGLDPGIDHCSAIAMLETLRARGRRVVSFVSFCGGLPAPEHADVPLRYKFSWSPRGVLGAALNDARFKLGGAVREIPGRELLAQGFADLPVSDVLKLEGIANRDSLPYAETYGLGRLEDLRTLVRGTIRYPGFSALMHTFKTIGLLETERTLALERWTDLPRAALSLHSGTRIPADDASFLSALRDAAPAPALPELLSALAALGLLPSAPAPCALPLPQAPAAPIDLLAHVLAHALRYRPGERDLVLLTHELVARAPGAVAEEEVHTARLAVYGDARASAMARTVGLPLAFAVRAVLDGGVRARGVCGPGVGREVWGAVLAGLDAAGLGMRESVETVRGGGRVERALAGAGAAPSFV